MRPATDVSAWKSDGGVGQQQYAGNRARQARICLLPVRRSSVSPDYKARSSIKCAVELAKVESWINYRLIRGVAFDLTARWWSIARRV